MLHRYKIAGPSLFLGIIMLAIGCTKVEKAEDIGEGGQTIVKIQSDDGYTSAFVELKSGSQTVNLLDVRRDIPNGAELNKTMKVIVKEDPAVLSVYNSHLEPADRFDLLPANSFTADASNPKSGSDYTVSFAAGEFSKWMKITVPNATILDPNAKYGLGFLVTSIDQTGKISKILDSVVVAVGVKNQWDGDYRAKGVFHHPVNGPRDIDENKTLATYSPNSVIANLGDLGSSGYQMILTINADNTVTIAPAGATPNIDQSWGDNYYDPATQSFHLHYSYNTAAPRIVEEVITRK